MNRVVSILMTASCLIFGGRTVSAQTAILQGTVVDDSGGALPGATVILTTPGGGNPREATTGRGGGFTYANLPEGTALVHVELPGFQAADVKVAIVGSHANEITVTLKVGFDEEVTVSADAAGGVLSPAHNADSVEFDPEALRRLPTDAQDLQSIVESFSSAAAPGGVSVVVDGVETDGLGIPASAIHRLILNRNPYSTEFKSPGKSRVEVETERGSRRYYHGSGALFWRSSRLQAQNAFAAAPAETNRALNEGTIGGPLPRRGWSFFASGQHLLNNDAAIINARTASGPIVQNVPTPERRSTVFGRVDLRPNKTDALTLRYDLFDDDERNHGVGGFRLAEQAYTTTERRHRFQANDHRILSTGVLNDLRIEAAGSDRVDGVLPQQPSVIVAGAFSAGPSQTFSNQRSTSVQLQDVSTVTRRPPRRTHEDALQRRHRRR
jgi:hypothetical protein